MKADFYSQKPSTKAAHSLFYVSKLLIALYYMFHEDLSMPLLDLIYVYIILRDVV